MTIKRILEQLETSGHPVAKSLHKGQHFNVLVIGSSGRQPLPFNAGMSSIAL